MLVFSALRTPRNELTTKKLNGPKSFRFVSIDMTCWKNRQKLNKILSKIASLALQKNLTNFNFTH